MNFARLNTAFVLLLSIIAMPSIFAGEPPFSFMEATAGKVDPRFEDDLKVARENRNWESDEIGWIKSSALKVATENDYYFITTNTTATHVDRKKYKVIQPSTNQVVIIPRAKIAGIITDRNGKFKGIAVVKK